MKLIKWGYDFEDAEKVFVVRMSDIKKRILAKKVLKLMEEDGSEDPEKFFQKSKICFLATQDIYIEFLLSLKTENEKKSL